ncbi:MAG: carbohydrate-binding protein [Alteromonadaceae bacterium]|nr:carbohydrate-binding protein [Alteromonadaceae bacterium]
MLRMRNQSPPVYDTVFRNATWHVKIIALLTFALFSAHTYSQSPNNQLRGGELQSIDEYRYGKVEVRMYSQRVIGTTSTFFWWRNGGHVCGTQWNEIDIETIPVASRYQSNPIWQTSDADCEIKRSEALHGSQAIYDTWVTYTLEWTPDYIAWYRDGTLDRRITRNNHPSVQHISQMMRYCFNLWSQGHANPDWLGNLDFNALQNKPVYQYVDYFRYYAYNGSGFDSTPTKVINFSSMSDITSNFYISNWEFGESKGYLSWSSDAVGIVDIGNNNKALWLGLFMNGQERAPQAADLPNGSTSGSNGGGSGNNGGGAGNTNSVTTIQAETTDNFDGLQVSGSVLAYIENGAWASFPAINIASAGEYEVSYFAASGGDGGSIQLERAGGSDVFGNVTIPATDGWGDYRETTHRVTLPAGPLSLGLYFADGGINLDRITLRPVTSQSITVQAENTDNSSGLQIVGSTLAYIDNGAWASYNNINIPSAGQYRITYRVASNGDGGEIQFERSGGSIVFGTKSVPNTGGWSAYENHSHTVTLSAGPQSFGLYFIDGGINLDSFTITKVN